ncbi:MAG: inositol monophosphatase [Pelagibacterales bacterium]|nr:inositol monophosphatase [Pelagibacterales bacterium]OUU62055.1 MAG: hypothetical protein CBC22_05665 [Alphaproteobacteria bacterium TMED62]|tara:strand:+ start:9328 stop:10110 length:783 start_codon:yes stop_codon:yes gene_type:complete
MQKKNIISTFLSLANYIADTIAIELLKYYKLKNTKLLKKKVEHQIVTDLDYKIEEIARKLIKSVYPDHNIIGEELKSINKKSNFTWIIDPIDGTKAFVSGIPVFTFLLSLKYKNNYVLGLVDQPILKERYWNLDNKAYLNGTQIKVSKYKSLPNSIIAITDPLMFNNYDLLNKKIFNKLNFIRWGTDALGYMRCAEGIIDGVIERNIKVWDIAAIIPILEASGGVITTWDNKTPGTNDTILACNNIKLHKILVNTLQKYI